MDDTLLFIPPCCVDKKLPKAVMQAPLRVLSFYTHGDVTMEKFYRAVSHLLIDAHVLVLNMPVVASDTAVFLGQCFDRGWVTDLILSSTRDCSALIKKYLSEYQDHILYECSNDVSVVSSHMVMYNADRALQISGPMYDHPHNAGLSAYTLVFYPNYRLSSSDMDWSNVLRNVLFPDVLRHRQHVLKEEKKMKSRELDKFINMIFPPYK